MAPVVLAANSQAAITIVPETEQALARQVTNQEPQTSNFNGKIRLNWVHSKAKPYKSPTAELVDRFIDEPRPLRVVVVGGGLAGILAGVLLPQKVPGIELTIYEKNCDFGGTWLENIYPGVRCDVPSHVYQSTFIPKKDWTDQFSPGAEIRDYWQSVARKYNVYQYANFHQKVMDATWDAANATWSVTVNSTETGETRVQEADFVLLSIGRFNEWKLPEYPGLSDYKGLLRHASHWDPSFEPKGKKVAVIGNGASGIQLVASLQKTVDHLDHYARSKTWIAASGTDDDRTSDPQPISQDKIDSFKDPKTYLAYRKEAENKHWSRFGSFFRNSELNLGFTAKFTDVMRKRLAKKPELLEHIVPDFSPHCRRLTPGPGYLEAIVEDNVDYIHTKIKRFTETGIETEDGVQRNVEAVFCATGSKTDLIPQFPIVANGRTLREVWDVEGEYGFPYTYFGLSTPGFPNLLFVNGPHGHGPTATLPQAVESQLTYFAKLLRKVSREGIKSIEASQKAADDFVEYSDAFFAKTVLSENCSSWYNGGRPGGRIHGLWPGSGAHLTIVRREPRWEDWNYEYLSGNGNRFLWYLGNGWTRKETNPESDMTSYLRVPEDTDLRDIHESWWSVP